MSLVYLGTSPFAASVLERLAAQERHRPALVVSRPDRPRGRGQRVSSPAVADAARRLGLPLAQPARVNDPETAGEIIATAAAGPGPATLVVCAFGALIGEQLLGAQPILNVHPSLLPRWRGAAPVERAIMAGDERTGVSIMLLTAGLDEGPVSLAGEEPIRSDDTYGTLAGRLEPLAAELLVRTLDESPPFHEQAAEGVTYAEKIGPADRILDPSHPPAQLERTVRALNPHIGARVQLPGGEPLGVWRARLAADPDPPAPGALQAREGRLLFGASLGALELLEVQPAGGRPMDAPAYLRGHPLA
ncbi:MAG TPA: methionyl-tRNA formyltransferase [Solirubrobacteraceae bacterium]|nr:methionyl-tRNA formyltransferase [Solirubrobacteraceae bacterium]